MVLVLNQVSQNMVYTKLSSIVQGSLYNVVYSKVYSILFSTVYTLVFGLIYRTGGMKGCVPLRMGPLRKAHVNPFIKSLHAILKISSIVEIDCPTKKRFNSLLTQNPYRISERILSNN